MCRQSNRRTTAEAANSESPDFNNLIHTLGVVQPSNTGMGRPSTLVHVMGSRGGRHSAPSPISSNIYALLCSGGLIHYQLRPLAQSTQRCDCRGPATKCCASIPHGPMTLHCLCCMSSVIRAKTNAPNPTTCTATHLCSDIV